MKANLVNLEKEVVGEISLSSSIFGLDARVDLVKRVIDWQLAKARSGDHAVKTVGEVSGSNKKPFKQKGTGNARQGNARGVQRRGGGIAHGPQVRSHAIKLQKKVRKLGMCHALSAKFLAGEVQFIELHDGLEPKTGQMAKILAKFSSGRIFIIEGDKAVSRVLQLSTNSLKHVNAVPVVGANVYDIVKSDCVLITKSALPFLEERLQ